ncbi:class I SAM-dependent methyltransferase [Yinghuangia sp. YIM S09857]|uniref:class I SAM-dependent methyltransferase n=1 Tax=Yinghuangia sp. YIM S09857 TaxID=3436929 RepID=UPI003F52DA5F
MKHDKSDKTLHDRYREMAEGFWDEEYAQGRFLDMPPDPFVADILGAAWAHGLLPGPGIYIGVGNGRNYFPLVEGGLDLVGLDISAIGLAAIRDRAPGHYARLVHGDLSALPPGETFPVVVGLNVFHHGDRDIAHAHIRAALECVAPGGLFCVRVNAAGTAPTRPTEVAAEYDDGSVTRRYLPEDGMPPLLSHFFTEPALAGLLAAYEPVLPLALDDTDIATGAPGDWRRWQGVYRRPA